MTNKEITTKARDIEGMVATSGWSKVVFPWIQGRIERLESIKKINPDNIERDYLTNKAKVDVYEGILNHINSIIKDGESLRKQEKLARR